MLVDVIAGRVMFGRMGDMLSDAGIGNVGSGTVDLQAIGMCSDDKPLLLITGDCVACDYKARENIDVLMGCEKCPNLEKRGINCLFQIDADENAQRDARKIIKEQVVKSTTSSGNGKYNLINMRGNDDLVRAVLYEKSTGRKIIISVGDVLNGAIVKSISLDNGIILDRDGVVEILDVK